MALSMLTKYGSIAERASTNIAWTLNLNRKKILLLLKLMIKKKELTYN